MDDLQRLVEVEAIKQLKARYMRCLDTKAWDELADCFSEDATSSYNAGAYAFDGREAIMKFLTDSMSSPRFLTMHHVHTPEIGFTSDHEATGLWYLEDRVIALDHGFELHGTGIYEDRYTKADGRWWITHTGYERVFEKRGALDPAAAEQYTSRFEQS
ncbi:MAG: nuclear transport factor 2 family protein [Myxococcota bacterium]|jgi:bile-acid 7alpha-dehydratase